MTACRDGLTRSSDHRDVCDAFAPFSLLRRLRLSVPLNFDQRRSKTSRVRDFHVRELWQAGLEPLPHRLEPFQFGRNTSSNMAV